MLRKGDILCDFNKFLPKRLHSQH